MELIIATVVLVILFVIIGIIVYEVVAKYIAFTIALVLLAFLPMKTDAEVLYEYSFARFETHGIVEYISPFDGESASHRISSIEIYNKMSRHEDILMKSYYSLLGFKTMEVFPKDP